MDNEDIEKDEVAATEPCNSLSKDEQIDVYEKGKSDKEDGEYDNPYAPDVLAPVFGDHRSDDDKELADWYDKGQE